MQADLTRHSSLLGPLSLSELCTRMIMVVAIALNNRVIYSKRLDCALHVPAK